jgi:hypothetical protein
MNKYMKFISKNANLRIVLRHAMPAEPITGRLAVPGLYIKFENGIVNVNNEEHVDMMLVHSGFDRDFIQVKEEQVDPYKNIRRENEPDHVITEFEHGRAEKLKGSSHNVRLDPKLKNAAVEMAKEMAKEMAPQLARDMLLEMAKQRKAAKAQEENTREAANPEESKPNELSQSKIDELEATDVGKTIDSEKTEMEDSSPATEGSLPLVGFKCSCGKVAKSKAGLIAHQRNCKEFKDEIKKE